MDGTIKVSTQELRSASSQFSSYGSEIQNLTSQMLSLISGITGAVWSGEAASKFAGLEADISKINKMIQEHVTDLNTMADEYDRAEQQAQQEASALKNNII